MICIRIYADAKLTSTLRAGDISNFDIGFSPCPARYVGRKGSITDDSVRAANSKEKRLFDRFVRNRISSWIYYSGTIDLICLFFRVGHEIDVERIINIGS